MQKSTVLAKQLEQLSSDARVNETKLQTQAEHIASLESSLERELTKNRALDIHCHTLEIKNKELTQMLEHSQQELQALKESLSRQQQEREDGGRATAQLIAEVRECWCMAC